MASSVAALDHAACGAIVQRVFRERSSTMSAEAQPFTVPELHDTLTGLRREMRALLETLPDAAFEPSAEVDGELSWCAGQVIAHMVDAQVNTFLRAARLATGMGPGSDVARYPDHAETPALSRDEALALLETGDRDLADIRASLPPDADVAATRDDEIMGAAGYKDMLLFLTIHDDDHLGQLRAMA